MPKKALTILPVAVGFVGGNTKLHGNSLAELNRKLFAKTVAKKQPCRLCLAIHQAFSVGNVSRQPGLAPKNTDLTDLYR